jgi:hypothetical protein
MSANNKIVVEVIINAPVDVVWTRSQDPVQHVAWDIRFTQIEYLPEKDARGFNLMDYRTNVALGIEVKGLGRYLHTTENEHSSFEFDSDDWKSIITKGKGVWIYTPRPNGTHFKTVYDYEPRYGIVGKFIDTIFFRPLLQLSTEWSFETLSLWCHGDETACDKRRPRWAFMKYFVARVFGNKPKSNEALSWLGTGSKNES